MQVLKCHEITELSTDYQEGALPFGQRFGVGFHLLMCGLCRRYMGQLVKTRALLGRGHLVADAAVEEQVLARLDEK